jgi:hypothetical protein
MMALPSTQENLMLKEVGSSGQISLGKKFAGQLFDVQFLNTGAVQMLPVRVVPASAVDQNGLRKFARPLQAVNPTAQKDWERDNALAIQAFNQRIELIGSPAKRLRAWQESKHGAV